MRAKQYQFESLKRPNDSFGGSLLKGNPKTRRPLDSKLPVHITLRATQSLMRLPKNFGQVDNLVETTAKKHGVRIYKYSNNGNHLHIGARVPRLCLWAPFIRDLTGKIARQLKLKWMFRPHTRIVRGWKKAFTIMKDYIYLNQLEAEGHINRKETKTLRDLRSIFES